MEAIKKACGVCLKEFTVKSKQQKYCGVMCAYRNKRKISFSSYGYAKEKQSNKNNERSSDLNGLDFAKESYSE